MERSIKIHGEKPKNIIGVNTKYSKKKIKYIGIVELENLIKIITF